MAKGMYLGVNGRTRKVKKLYIGVNGRTRKVKKVYIGVNGRARLCWSGEPSYYGRAGDMTSTRSSMGCGTVGGYALMAGGTPGSNAYNSSVDVYRSSLTRSSADAMSQARSGIATAGAGSGSYLLFAGGLYGRLLGMYNISSTVDTYNTSLTKVDTSALPAVRYKMAGVSNGTYAVFAGGWAIVSGSSNKILAPDAAVVTYNGALTRSTAYDLSTARSEVTCGMLDGWLAFAGGVTTRTDATAAYSTALDWYDRSLVRYTILSALPVAAIGMGCATVGDSILFVGGEDASGAYLTNVTAYDTSLTRTLLTSLPRGTSGLKGAKMLNEEFVLFAGGKTSAGVSAAVYLYDDSLTRTTLTSMSSKRSDHAAAAVGSYVLFAGGETESGTCADVDAYTAG